MNTTFSLVTFFLLLFALTPVSAVPPGMTVEFSKNSFGPVIFSGEAHARHKLNCQACHPKIFQQKNGSTNITLADHSTDKASCFACHNGKVAFKSEGNCKRCHQTKN
jgi:c(7)-type cytochrome triheme protein